MRMKAYLDSPITQKRVCNAINELAAIVGKTLGPGGRPILLQQDGPPLSTKDGVTVAQHFGIAGDVEQLVANAAKEVCERTNQTCGDGTTTAIVLANALVKHGQDWMNKNPGYSPQRLCRSLNKFYESTIKPEILAMARPIKDLPIEEARAAIHHVAMVSSNHDEEIADAVADAVGHVGEDGMVHAEEGTGAKTRVVKEDGFSFNSGLSDLGVGGPLFVNRKSYQDCVVEGAYVALYDGDLNDINTVHPIMDRVATEQDGRGNQIRRPLVIFAHNFSDQVIKMMAQNFRRGTLTIVPVKTASTGQNLGRQHFLHDVASYVGGDVFDAHGNRLQDAFPSQLGFIDSFKFTRKDGVLWGKPDEEAVMERINELKEQQEGASAFDKDLLRYRIGRLAGGIATIYAGGSSALEAKERHARVIDAVSAVRSALELGVVPGGGTCLALISKDLLANVGPHQIFEQALMAPYDCIIDNTGVEHPPFPDGEKVFDVLKQKMVDWWDGGIMDPAKVTITALENALSVAQLLITLGGCIVVAESDGEAQVKAMQEGILKQIQEGAFDA